MANACNRSEVRVAIPSGLEWLGVIDKVVEGIVEQLGVCEDDANAIAISVVEAGTNAIQHGHAHKEMLPVEFIFDLGDDALCVEVRDRGPGFDVEKALSWDPTSPEGLLASRGRGIFIMKSLMDDVSFQILEGEGCRVTLKKLLKPSGS